MKFSGQSANLLKNILAGVGFSWIVSSHLYAVVQDQMFDSTRVNGRGRAYVAGMDSDDATILNPATIGETNITYQLRPLEMNTSIGRNTLASINDISSLMSSGAVDGPEILGTFDSKFGKRQALKGQVGLLSQRFGHHELRFFGAENFSLELQNPAIPYLDWLSDSNVGGSWSSSFQVMPNLFVGGTARIYQRYYIAGQISTTDLTQFLSSSVDMDSLVPVASGLGLGFDLGAIYRANPNLRLGFLITDIGDSGYLSKKDIRPPLVKQRINLGLMYRRPLTSSIYFDAFFDYQNILNRDHLSLFRLLKTGVEVGRRWFTRDNDIGLTAGINEGWLAAGFFVDCYVFRLDFASYGVELGRTPGQKQDRFYSLALKTSLSF